MNLSKIALAFCVLAQLFFSTTLAAQSTAVLNVDSLRKYYPIRGSIMDRPIPNGFMEYRPFWTTNWLLVERINDQDTSIDRSSIKEKSGSAAMFAVFHTINIRPLRLFNKLMIEEYTWREVDCARGGSLILKAIYKSESNEWFEVVFIKKDLPFIAQTEMQIDIACVRL
jgi:hypothetical protein